MRVRLLDGTVLDTYIGKCCREWVMLRFMRGRCGACGTEPKYLREDDQ